MGRHPRGDRGADPARGDGRRAERDDVFVADGHERAGVAQVAARLIAEHGIGDWSLAKRKAARQLGLPDRAYVASLMGRVTEPGRFANWIAPPARGIDNQPVEFEYVRFN